MMAVEARAAVFNTVRRVSRECIEAFLPDKQRYEFVIVKEAYTETLHSPSGHKAIFFGHLSGLQPAEHAADLYANDATLLHCEKRGGRPTLKSTRKITPRKGQVGG